MSKSSKIIIGLLIVILVAVLGVGGYIIVFLSNKTESEIGTETYVKTDKDNAMENKKEEKNSEKLEENNLIKDKSKKIVYEYSNMQIEDTVENPPQMRSFPIPQININSLDAERINKEIMKTVNEEYEICLQCKKDGGLVPGDFDYVYYINDDILSLVMKNDIKTNDIKTYYIYNMNIKTGKELENEEIIKLKGISEDEFANKLSTVLKSEMLSPDEFAEMKNTVKEFNEKTVSKTNCSYKNVKMFLNEKNELCVLGTVFIPAGSGEYKVIVNIDKTKKVE